ncbi:MAG: M1 family aminopeptidase [Candidatus Njordarchaeia archaeon]
MVWVVKHGRDFAFPDYTLKYPRQPRYKLEHVFLKIWLHIHDRKIDGEVEIKFKPLIENFTYLDLDAVDMAIKKVTFMGEEVKYNYDGEKLFVYFDKPLGKENQYSVVINYSTEPKKGLYFVLPDKNYPDRVPQVWSQGEPEETRYWIPIYDYPNNRCTWEILAYAPKDFTVLSNGKLVDNREEGDWAIWHWEMNTPQPTYLITLVVGIFDYMKDYYEDVPLYYYVPKGMGIHINRSFSRTKDILKFYSEYLRFKYPYERYTQVCVSEFIAGGMENTTLTVLTDWTLHDEKAHMDFESEPLVAHEAAHQWFGDLVTMKDWGNLWLNESFATYLENLYLRHWKGEEEFVYAMYSDLKSYLREYGTRYSRPIVTRVYKYPEEVFDMHSYPKGALVLHTLMNFIGENVFRESLKVYLERYKFKNVDTEDLRKVFEEVTGLDLEWFFDQFVYNAGHPVLKVSYSWDNDQKILKLVFKQAQDKDSLDVYRLRVKVEFFYKEKKSFRFFDLKEKEQIFYFPMEEQPEMIIVDPEFQVFKVLEYDYPMEALLKILKKSKYVYPKLVVLEKLVKFKSNKVISALGEVLMNKNEFWGVRREAARTLGSIGGEKALSILIEAEEKVIDKKVRRGIVEALGNFKDARAADVLKKVLTDKEESYYVRNAAAISLGKTRVPEAMETLLSEIDTPSHNYVITRGVLRGLAELGTDDALEVILKYSEIGKPTLVRIEAVASLGKFPKNKKAYDAIRDALKDEYVRVRGAALMAIAELRDPEFLGDLDSIIQTELYDSMKRRAREIRSKILKNLEKGVEYKKLLEEIEKVREEHRSVIDRLEKLEQKA